MLDRADIDRNFYCIFHNITLSERKDLCSTLQWFSLGMYIKTTKKSEKLKKTSME